MVINAMRLRNLSLFLVAFLGGCSSHVGPPQLDAAHGAPVMVTTAPVQLVTAPLTREVVGTVRSKTVSAIQSKVVGQVLSVHVREGDMVDAGALLIEIDDRELKAHVARSQSALSEARQSLDEVRKAAQAAQHTVEAANAQRSLAESEFTRSKQLIEQSAISKSQFDQAEAAYKAAAATAFGAAEMLSSYLSKKNAVEARGAQAESEVTLATTMLSHTQIKAPIAGIVTMKNVDVGDMASPGSVLLEIEDRQNYRLEALVDETGFGRIKEGDSVKVTIDALQTAAMTGIVAQIVPATDSSSRTFVAKIDLPAQDGLRTGLFGRATFAMGEKKMLAAPAASVIQRGQLTSVFVVGDDNIARLRLVKAGKTIGETIEILSGVNDAEQVIVAPPETLQDGWPVARS